MIADILTEVLVRDMYKLLNKILRMEYNATLQSGRIRR